MEPDHEGGEPSVSLARPTDEIQLNLRKGSWTDDLYFIFEVELSAPGLRVRSSVTTLSGDQLEAFFERLAADWRGWAGERVWDSLEHQMSLAATHDGLGHVQLRVTLRGGDPLDGWSATASLQHGAGDEMTMLARRIARFMRTD